ncbi:hypothetical protein AB833_05880 [Chromatiales bacterium (ex Bugula neritina AB1)]|nr:hypothetical protein AB833_05880 [Chromatiales bacterium (ex Bugula neritina AB1)]
MKAMLLAAGRGERLKPLTDHTAKPLVKAAGKSLIEYHLLNLATADFSDVVINTCWKAEKIVNALGDGSSYGLHINYSHEETALETAGGIARALPILGTGMILVISADIWCDLPLTQIRLPATGVLAHLIVVPNPSHKSTGDFDLRQDRLEHRGKGSSGLTYAGIGIYHTSLFANLDSPCTPLRDVLHAAITRKVITAQVHRGAWFDVGTLERLQQLESYLSDTSG